MRIEYCNIYKFVCHTIEFAFKWYLSLLFNSGLYNKKYIKLGLTTNIIKENDFIFIIIEPTFANVMDDKSQVLVI